MNYGSWKYVAVANMKHKMSKYVVHVWLCTKPLPQNKKAW